MSRTPGIFTLVEKGIISDKLERGKIALCFDEFKKTHDETWLHQAEFIAKRDNSLYDEVVSRFGDPVEFFLNRECFGVDR